MTPTRLHVGLTLATLSLVALSLGACTSPPPERARGVATPAARSLLTAAPASSADALVDPPAEPLWDGVDADVTALHVAALSSPLAHDRLRHLCDVIGPRLSGSAGLTNAIEWAAATLRADGIDVDLQDVMVPHWVRGDESLALVKPRAADLQILGLGNSVGTPEGGITAEVVVCRDFDEMDAHAERVRGRIVLFDAAMPPFDPERGAGYGQTVVFRTAGASRAGALGAVGCLVRSVTATSLGTPHTGMLRYESDKPRIPAAAVTTEDAAMMRRLQDAGETITVTLHMEAHFEDDAPSANVIAEIRGTERPEEVVLISGHLDSWDVGQGAHDDGGSCVAVMTALTLLREMFPDGPKRTIRAVLFTNEENGLRGSRDYVNGHAAEIPSYQAAIEADSGTYRPLGFSAPAAKDQASSRVRARLERMARHLAPLGAGRLRDGGGGADIGPMAAFGVPLLGLQVAGDRYFDIHHTRADTFDKVDPVDLARCTAVLAATAHMLANMPERLTAE